METRQLGTDGPEISVVGYGAWEAGGTQWGANTSDDDVIASMRALFDAGMNWIDTAEVYGKGRSEELVARGIAGRRDEVLVFTKVAPDEEGTGIRPYEIRRAIRGSLGRLNVDHVDLYQVHWPDPRIPIEDTWGAMAELVSQGFTRWIGLSNFGREDVERCSTMHPVTSLQNEFSLLRRDDRAELLPWLAEHGVGYLAYGPMAFGLLTGRSPPTRRSWRATGGASSGPAEEPKGRGSSPPARSSGTWSSWRRCAPWRSARASRFPRWRSAGRSSSGA